MAASSNEKGYTMLETIMYISLMMVLGASIASYVSKAFTRYKTGRVTQQVLDLKKAIAQYTAASADYKELRLVKEDDKNGMLEDKALPLDMKNGSHALGGKIKIGSAANLLAMADTDKMHHFMFYITFESLTQNSCVEVITQGQFYGEGSDLDALIINDSIWRYEYSLFPTQGYTIPQGNKEPNKINIQQALAACAKKVGNQITWIFS